MLFHVVMMRFNDRGWPEFHAQVEAFARRVRRECAGLVQYDYGINVAARGKGYERVVLSIFKVRSEEIRT